MKRNEYFEGDYRRKPSQNLSGRKNNREVSEFINKVQNERKKREVDRTVIIKATALQAIFRGRRCRKILTSQLKNELSSKIFELKEKNKLNVDVKLEDIKYLVAYLRFIYPKNFPVYLGTEQDYNDMFYIINNIINYQPKLMLLMIEDPDWLWRIIYILYLSMNLIKSLYLNNNERIPLLLEVINGFLNITNTRSDMISVKLSTIIEKTLRYGLLKILILLLENCGFQSKHILHKNRIIVNARNLVKVLICSAIRLNDPILQEISLKLLAEDVIFQKMSTETKSLISSALKEVEEFPLDKLCDVILNHVDESLFTIHSLHNILTFFNEILGMGDEKKYYLLVSKLTLKLPILLRFRSSLYDNDEFKYLTYDEEIAQDCLNIINNSKNTEKWLASIYGFIKRKDYEGIFCFSKCLYHLWLVDCTPIYKSGIFSKIGLYPPFLKELWNFISSEKRIISVSQKLYTATTLQMLSNGVSITALEADRIIITLTMFCFFCKNIIPFLRDDLQYTDEFCKEESFFCLKEILSICNTLKDVAIGIISLAFPSKPIHGVERRIDESTPTGNLSFNSLAWRTLLEELVSFLRLLHNRDCQRQYTKCSSFWISSGLKDLNPSFSSLKKVEDVVPFSLTPQSLSKLFTVYENRYLAVLRALPFTIEFLKRYAVYQNYINENKLELQDDHASILQIPNVQLTIRRDYLYEDAFEQLYSEPEIKKLIRVHMISQLGMEEQGIDGGGLFREFMIEFLKTAFDPNRGFFVSNHENEFYPNPNIHIILKDFKTHYNFIGRMVGKALFENIVIDVALADFFLSQINVTSNETYVNELASLDPDLYKNLISLTCYEGDLSELGLDFSLTVNDFGEGGVVELKPNGKDIPVNEKNVIEYIHLVARFKALIQLKDQTASFFQGLDSVIPLEWLRIFTSGELQLIISGNKSPIEVEDMKKHTVYSGGYSAHHPTIEIFWNVIRSFNDQQRSLLLKFVTSCSRPPLLGFKELFPPFCIQLVEYENNRLPSSSTCMNILKLPEFTNEETMRERLLYAIESKTGFELV